MTMQKFLIGAMACCAIGIAHAEINKCTNGEKVSFTDKACPAGTDSTPVEARVPKIGTSNHKEQATANALTRGRHRQELTLQIRDRQRQIQLLEQQMSNEIAELEKERSRAANNVAGATWLQNLSTQQSAIASRYQTLIQAEQARIAEDQKVLDEL